jgi:hypothetical protein
MADFAMGPLVLHIMIEAPADGIETRVVDLDPVLDAEGALIDKFRPTPIAEIPALPRDSEDLLARMVTTDPAQWPPPSGAFAVYGATGALRAQTPAIRKDKLYEKWGVDRLAVSGDQHLYRLRDHQAALDMQAEITAEFSGGGEGFEADPQIPDEHCFRLTDAVDAPGFACQVIVGNLYTLVKANTATSAKQMAAAQYALLAARR